MCRQNYSGLDQPTGPSGSFDRRRLAHVEPPRGSSCCGVKLDSEGGCEQWGDRVSYLPKLLGLAAGETVSVIEGLEASRLTDGEHALVTGMDEIRCVLGHMGKNGGRRL